MGVEVVLLVTGFLLNLILLVLILILAFQPRDDYALYLKSRVRDDIRSIKQQVDSDF